MQTGSNWLQPKATCTVSAVYWCMCAAFEVVARQGGGLEEGCGWGLLDLRLELGNVVGRDG